MFGCLYDVYKWLYCLLTCCDCNECFAVIVIVVVLHCCIDCIIFKTFWVKTRFKCIVLIVGGGAYKELGGLDCDCVNRHVNFELELFLTCYKSLLFSFFPQALNYKWDISANEQSIVVLNCWCCCISVLMVLYWFKCKCVVLNLFLDIYALDNALLLVLSCWWYIFLLKLLG